MGAVTASNTEFDFINSQKEFEEFFKNRMKDGFEPFYASFENHSEDVRSASLSGDIQGNELASHLHKVADLTSFGVRARDGRRLSYEFCSEELSIRELEYYHSLPAQVPEWQTLYMAGLCVLYGFNLVDDFIDRNGLRPVVDEIQRRKWAIMIALMLFSIIK